MVLFFVLSGFVIAVAHGADLGRGTGALRFLWRRCCRIYPIYWCMLAILVHQFWGAPSVTPSSILRWVTLAPVPGHEVLIVAWTLRQEVVFYLMFALCLVPFVGRVVLACWVVGTVLLVLVMPGRVAVPSAELAVAVRTVFSPFNIDFLAGLTAGLLLPRLPGSARLGAALFGCGLAALLWRLSVDNWGYDYGPDIARPVYGAAMASIVLGAALLERSAAWPMLPGAAQIAVWAGAFSYPLYLAHLLVIDSVLSRLIASGVAVRIGPSMTFVIVCTAAILVATLMAWLLDQPIQRLLRGVSAGSSSRRQGRAGPPTPITPPPAPAA